MPKKEIDYSNTIIYKITCLDPNITDVYVGHTTNFVQRKKCHQNTCINEKSDSYNCKLYKTIRYNGGWSNWKMEIINFFNCVNHYEARQKEQEYFTLLKANLNSIEPLPKPKIKTDITPIETNNQNIIYCQPCSLYFQNSQLLEIHNNTKKHIKMCNPNNNVILNKKKFVCEICIFTCFKNNDWNRHLSTRKHLNAAKIFKNNATEKDTIKKELVCECGKEYKYRQTLFVHKKKCKKILDNNKKLESNSEIKNENLINYLMKQNTDLKNIIMELVKKDFKNNTDEQ